MMKFQVQRDLNRAIKLLFDENKIDIPFNQLVVHQPENSFSTASEQQKQEAQRLVNEHQEKGKTLQMMIQFLKFLTNCFFSSINRDFC